MIDGAAAELKALFFWALTGVAGALSAIMAWVFNDMNKRIDTKADGDELTRLRNDSGELWRAHHKGVEDFNARHREQMQAISQVAEAVARIEGKLDK